MKSSVGSSAQLCDVRGADTSFGAARYACSAGYTQSSQLRLATALRAAAGIGCAGQHGRRRSTARAELYVILVFAPRAKAADSQMRRRTRNMEVLAVRSIPAIRRVPPHLPRTCLTARIGITRHRYRISRTRRMLKARIRPSLCCIIHTGRRRAAMASENATDLFRRRRAGPGITRPWRTSWISPSPNVSRPRARKWTN